MKLINLGRVVITPGIVEQVKEPLVLAKLLDRHERCDWGELDDEDKERNERSFEAKQGRVMSEYTHEGKKIWIFTEFAGSENITTILTPKEY